MPPSGRYQNRPIVTRGHGPRQVGTLCAGTAIDVLGPYSAAYLVCPFAVAILVPTALGWSGEKRAAEPKVLEVICEAVTKSNSGLLTVGSSLGAAAVAASVCAILDVSPTVQLWVLALGLSATFVLAWCEALPQLAIGAHRRVLKFSRP